MALKAEMMNVIGLIGVIIVLFGRFDCVDLGNYRMIGGRRSMWQAELYGYVLLRC